MLPAAAHAGTARTRRRPDVDLEYPDCRMPKLARTCWIVGLTVIGLSTLAVGVGLIRTWQALGASGLSEADKHRIQSNGLAEAVYNMSFGVLLGTVPLAIGWWVRRRAPQPR